MENEGYVANSRERREPLTREQKAFRTHVKRQGLLPGVQGAQNFGDDAGENFFPETDEEFARSRASSEDDDRDDASGGDEDAHFQELLFRPSLLERNQHKSRVRAMPTSFSSASSTSSTTWYSYSTASASASALRPKAAGGAPRGNNDKNSEFSAALQRWRLHKQCSEESSSYYPSTSLDSFLHEQEESTSADEWEEKELERIAAEQHRVLSSCFRKLALNSQGRRETRERGHVLIAKRQAALFQQWHDTFRAVRTHRLTTLSKTIHAWSALVDVERRYAQLCLIGESYHELASKRRALARLMTFRRGRRRTDILEKRVHEASRTRRLRFAMRTWTQRAAFMQRQRNAKSAADAYRRMLGLFTGLDVLKRNASLAVRARKIYHTSQRRSALEALQRWRAHLEHRTHQQMQLEGAELMHAFRLCKRILTAWREVCKEEQVARYACARMNRVLARQALRQLGRVAATRLVLDEREKMGYRHWATRRAARALRLLLEHAVERNQSCDAAALRDVQRMRRAFGGWLSTVWLSKCERVAARHWRRVQTQRGLTALRLNWVSATATGAQGSLAAVFNRRRILSQYLGAWQSYYLEALESRIALHAADRVRRLRLSHTVFSAWRDFVFMRADLALAFDQVRTAKLAQTCLVAWHREASCWIRHRNAVQRGQTRRAFLAWQEIAAAASLQRYELRLAAMFYRKCLLTRTFTLWVDFWYLQRYEGHVMGMAARHADSHLLRTVLFAWQAWTRDARPCAPLSDHDADVLYGMRLVRRCFRHWSHESMITSRLGAICQTKLGSAQAKHQVRAIAASSHMQKSALYLGLLYEAALKRRSLKQWKRSIDEIAPPFRIAGGTRRGVRASPPPLKGRGALASVRRPPAVTNPAVRRGAWSETAYVSALSQQE